MHDLFAIGCVVWHGDSIIREGRYDRKREAREARLVGCGVGCGGVFERIEGGSCVGVGRSVGVVGCGAVVIVGAVSVWHI